MQAVPQHVPPQQVSVNPQKVDPHGSPSPHRPLTQVAGGSQQTCPHSGRSQQTWEPVELVWQVCPVGQQSPLQTALDGQHIPPGIQVVFAAQQSPAAQQVALEPQQITAVLSPQPTGASASQHAPCAASPQT